MRLAATLAVLLFAAPAWADDGADLAVHAYTKACLDHAGQMDRLAAKLARGGEWELPPLAPDTADMLLAGRAGTAYAYPNRVTGAAILLLQNGGCTVAVQKADAAAVTAGLEKALAKIGKPGKPSEVSREGVTERRWTLKGFAASVITAPGKAIEAALTLTPLH